MAKLPRWSTLLLSLSLLAGPSLSPASAGTDSSHKTIGQPAPAYSEADRLLDSGLAQVNRSNLRQGLLDYQKALALYQRDRNEQGILTVHLNSAIIYSNWGQYQKALDLLTPLITRQTQILNDPKQLQQLHPRQQLALRTNLRLARRSLGQIYFALGNSSKAEETFRSAFAQAYGRSLGDNDCLWDTVIWNDLGRILALQGKLRDAQLHHEHAFRLIEAIGYDSSAAQLVKPLQKPGEFPNRPIVQSPQERFDQMTANRSLCFRNPTSFKLPPFPPLNQQIGNDYKLTFLRKEMRIEFLDSLQSLAGIYQRQGQFRDFDYVLNRGLVLSDRWGHKPGVIGLLSLRAEQQTTAADLKAALKTYEQILPIAQSINDTAAIGKAYHHIGQLQLLLKQPQAAAAALTKAVESWDQLRTNLTDLDKISLQETQADTYRLLQQALISTNQPNQALVAAERGRTRAFVDLLTRRLGDRAIATPKAPDLAQIQETARSKNATIVEYSVMTDRLIYAWVIPPNGPIGFRTIDLSQQLGPNQTLTNLLDEVRRNDLWVRGRGRSAEAAAQTIATTPTAQGEASLNTLHKLLWQPIASLLPTDPNASVIIIPQGDLFFVPFAALLDDQGRYLIEQHSLSSGPSIQSLQLTQQSVLPRPIAGAAFPGQSLVVGNPTMPQVRLEAGQPLQTLSTLPGAQVEAESIAQFINTKAWIGAQATKAKVVAQMPQSRLIHFATHGLLQDFKGLGMPGAIALAPGPGDNGLLTADEILDLKLNADLVVLSACYTGRGRVTDDGVLGLSRSLLAAGAPSVIVSLWAVPDEPTAQLMTAFYQNLQQSPNKAQALRQAMMSMIDRYPSPRDWAAFTLIGEAK
jgi:CHAT domain-containing protein